MTWEAWRREGRFLRPTLLPVAVLLTSWVCACAAYHLSIHRKESSWPI